MKTTAKTIRRVDALWLNVEIGKRLRRLRKLRGLTLAEVAMGVGVTRAAVNNWELGKSQQNFIVATLYNLALFYHVNAKRLLP